MVSVVEFEVGEDEGAVVLAGDEGALVLLLLHPDRAVQDGPLQLQPRLLLLHLHLAQTALALLESYLEGRPLLLLLVLPAVPAQHQHCALVLQTEDAGGYPAAGDDVPADGDERPLLGLNRVNLRRRRQLLVVGLLASREKTLNSSKF